MTSPMDLPRRLVASIGNSIDAAGELPVFQQKVLEHLASMDAAMSQHLASMDESTAALVDLIEPMRADIADLASRSVAFEGSTASMEKTLGDLQRSIGDDASTRLKELTALVARMEALVAHIDQQIPDPDAPGPVAKVKDLLVGEGG